jgi:hypothetical protein
VRLRLVTGLIYALLAFLGVATIGTEVRLALAALIHRYSYLPDLTHPWVWVGLAAALALALADALRRLLAGSRVGMARYAAILLILGFCFLARKVLVTPSRPTINDGVAHLVARVEVAADAVYNASKEYTDDTERLTEQWPPELRSLGFFGRGGLPLRSRLSVLHDGAGPELVAPPEVRPGDVVLVLSRDRKSYWITCFRLDRAGRVAPVTDERGRVVVATAANGRPASRLDPLFPEYPHKTEGQGQ